MDARISASAAAFDAIASRYDDHVLGRGESADRDDARSACSAPSIAISPRPASCWRSGAARAKTRCRWSSAAIASSPAIRPRHDRDGAGEAGGGRADRRRRIPAAVRWRTSPTPGRRAGGPSTACSRTSRRSTARCRWRRCGCCSSGRCAGAGASWRSSSPASARWRWPCSWRGRSRGARCAGFAAPPSPTWRDSASRCGTTAPATSTARSAPGFRRIETRSLGLFLPPLGFGNAFARVPGLLPALAAIEDRIAGLPGLRRMGDHVLLVYERA